MITGGLRARLIRDSVYRMLEESLGALGWFDVVPSHQPVRLVAEPIPQSIEVPLNTVALSDEDDSPEPIEMGSGLTEFTWVMTVDVYGESDSLSLHLVRDVEAVLAGRIPSIGRGSPTVDVWNYSLATPVVAFVVQIEDVRTDKAHDFPQPWLRFWRSCVFHVVDEHAGEGG